MFNHTVKQYCRTPDIVVMAASVHQDVCLFKTPWLNSLVCTMSCRCVTAIVVVVVVQFLRFVRQIGEGSVTVEDRAGKQLADKAQAREAQNWASSFTQVRTLTNLIKRACAACSHLSSCCLVRIKTSRRTPLPCASKCCIVTNNNLCYNVMYYNTYNVISLFFK